MSVEEAESYVNGMRKRPRDMMEASRMICQVVHKVLTGEVLNLDFDWDNEITKWDEESIEDAISEARQMEEWMKRMNNGKDRRKPTDIDG